MLTAPKVRCEGMWAERRDVIKATYDNAIARGDKNVYIIYGTEHFGEVGMDYTADGTHPTDLGYYLMAQRIAPVLKEALEKSESRKVRSTLLLAVWRQNGEKNAY